MYYVLGHALLTAMLKVRMLNSFFS